MIVVWRKVGLCYFNLQLRVWIRNKYSSSILKWDALLLFPSFFICLPHNFVLGSYGEMLRVSFICRYQYQQCQVQTYRQFCLYNSLAEGTAIKDIVANITWCVDMESAMHCYCTTMTAPTEIPRYGFSRILLTPGNSAFAIDSAHPRGGQRY